MRTCLSGRKVVENIIFALVLAYTSAVAGLLMGCSLLAALGIVSTTGVVVTLALGYRMTWADSFDRI